MCSLALFPPPPPRGHVTLCERNNELIAVDGALNLYRWLISMRTSFHPHYLVRRFTSCMLIVHNSPLRAFAWHPHTAKLALALLDDSIRIFYVKSRTVPVLRHRCQRGVADLAWRPMAAAGLAVACRGAVVIWQVEPSSLSTRPSSCCVQVLNQPGPVTSLAWNPHGEMLIAASPASSSLKVWEVATERCITLPVHGAGGIANLSWSPDGAHLLVATLSPVIRSDRRQWKTERPPTYLCACWSPDGSILLFAVQGEHVIYSLRFTTGAGMQQSAQNKLSIVGGEVQMMTWDSTGERLAVLLRGENNIAIFKTRTHPLFELLPCGFVQGEEGTVPQLMSFFPTFGKGALLTVVSLQSAYYLALKNDLS
uniref:Achalasia, adrenocortical insufficiency, alacrimia n=1 Tax=Eptatretus burgeri TaxID=7764 RepID=A0A8C4R2P6_EPTBU